MSTQKDQDAEEEASEGRRRHSRNASRETSTIQDARDRGESRVRLVYPARAYRMLTSPRSRHSVSESPLLRLPIEIREVIWALVLGHHVLHVETYHDFARKIDRWVTTCCLCPYTADQIFERSQKTAKELYEVGILNYDTDPTQTNMTVVEGGYERCISRGEHTIHDPHTECAAVDRQRFPDLDLIRKKGGRSEARKKLYLPIQLQRVCHQIHDETSTILWSTNTFIFFEGVAFENFMQNRTLAQRMLIQTLGFDIQWASPQIWKAWDDAVCNLPLVNSFVGLKRLDIHIYQPHCDLDFDPYSYQARKEIQLWSDECLEGLARYRMLPIRNATVVIRSIGDISGFHPWPQEECIQIAEQLRQTILDPKNVQSLEDAEASQWKKEQDHTEAAKRNKQVYRCNKFSTWEECAQHRQAQQDHNDRRAGRTRTTPKIVGPCAASHLCLICYKDKYLCYQSAIDCLRPGRCDQPEESELVEGPGDEA